MKSKISLKEIFDVFLENERVTLESFLRKGFSKEDVLMIVNKGIISNLGAFYVLKREYTHKLSRYGDILAKEKKCNKAIKAYDLCAKLNFYGNVRLKKILAYIQCEKYEDAFKCLKIVDGNLSDYVYFYLFMLGHLYDLPSEYKFKIDEYRKKVFSGKLKFNKGTLLEVFNSALKYRFNFALKLLDKIDDPNTNTSDIVLTKVFIKLVKEKIVNLETIEFYLINGNFYDTLELIQDYLRDNHLEKYALLIVNLFKLYNNCGDYTVPLNILYNLKNNNICIDYDYYVSSFNDAFDRESWYEAKVILNILIEINSLGLANVNIDDFKRQMIQKGYKLSR